MDLIAFLMAIWQHLQCLNLLSQCTSTASLWDLDLSANLPYNCCVYRFIFIFGLASTPSLRLVKWLAKLSLPVYFSAIVLKIFAGSQQCCV